MKYEVGKKYYLYECRAEMNVCCAHILAILPHPERDDDNIIVYRWYGRHKQWWWYGVTDYKEQELWKDYTAKAEKKLKQRTDGRHK